MLSAAIIIERTSIRLGGAERSVSELAQELKAQGVHTQILAAAGKPGEDVRILCSQQDRRRTSWNTFETAIKQYLSEHPFDIVHSTLPLGCADIYQPRGGSFKEAMLQNAASYSTPWLRLWKEKSHFLNFRRTAFLRAEARLCAEHPQTIIAALSEYVKQQFLRHYHLPESRIAVIANGINPNRPADPQKSQAFRRGILDKIPTQIRDKAILLFFAATNFRLKGLREAIISLSKAIELCPQCPAVIVAAGSNQISAYQRLARQYRVGDRILFCGPQQETATAMTACDAAILPSWYDPCSRFILEALAAGKPVITTTFNGASEQYEAGRHGFIIQSPSDIFAMAKSIADLANPDTIQRLAGNILADNLKERVSISRHVRQLLDLYKMIIERKKGRHSR